MKSRSWMWTTVVYLFAALAMPVSLVMTSLPAHAQRPGLSERNSSSTWTGGNRMLQTSNTQPLTAKTKIETVDHNTRYKVVTIPVPPGKTTTYLTTQRDVNNIGHVTGYSYVYSGTYF